MAKQDLKIDLTVLVDIISNVAGMMILLACISLFVQTEPESAPDLPLAKPISFPLTYLPLKKHSITIALKNGQLYEMPSRELLEQLTSRTSQGEVIESLELEKDGVLGRIEITQTALGFRFKYSLLPEGGLQLKSPVKVKEKLDELLKSYPPEQYFLVVHSWPEEFAAFRDIREYMNENEMEVGWQPRIALDPNEVWHLQMAIGEYSEGFSSIKAQ